MSTESLRKSDDGQNPLFSAEREQAVKEAFFDAVCLMVKLRANCPWDAKQSPQSLKRYVVEEAYEVVDAIDDEDWDELRKELGDFVFQVLFQAQIQEEQGRFDIESVLRELVAKMMRRHPHVFGDQRGIGMDQIHRNWDEIKRREKGQPSSLFDGFPKALPALQAAYKIGKKTESVPFDWNDADEVLDKVREELAEMEAEIDSGNRTKIREEMGDFLFTVAQLCRKLGQEPEETLRQANSKFMRRFRAMESQAAEQGLDLTDMSHAAKEELWERIKTHELR